MLDKLVQLFVELDNAQIAYCHWKSTDHLMATLRGETDADLLVKSRQHVDFESLVARLGFVRLQTVSLRSYPGVHDFVALDSSGVWTHLHVHYQLVVGDRWVKAYRIPIEEAILSNRYWREDARTWTVHPRHELLLFCLRMPLKFRKPYVRPRTREELEYLRTQASEAEELVQELPESLGSLRASLSVANAGVEPDWSKLNSLARQVRRQLSFFRRLNAVSFYFYSATRRVFRYRVEFSRRFLKDFGFGRRTIVTGGKIIAFVGMDGCGKTSAVKRMEKFFSTQLNVTRVYLGNGRSGASWYRKALFSLLGDKAQMKGHREVRDVHSPGPKKAPWYYLLWVALCNLDRQSQLRLAISSKASGSLVLSDRWPQTKVSGAFDGPKLLGMLSKRETAGRFESLERDFFALASFCPPDLIVKFKVTPSVAISRKPDDLNSGLAERYEKVLDSLVWPSVQIVEIDADRSTVEVDEVLKEIIWNCCCGK